MKLLSAASLFSLALFCRAQSALAATSLGDRAKSLTSELSSYGGLAVGVFALIGIIMVGGGFLGLKKAQERSDSKLGPALSILVGVVLCSISAIINMSSQSVVGSDATELQRIGL